MAGRNGSEDGEDLPHGLGRQLRPRVLKRSASVNEEFEESLSEKSKTAPSSKRRKVVVKKELQQATPAPSDLSAEVKQEEAEILPVKTEDSEDNISVKAEVKDATSGKAIKKQIGNKSEKKADVKPENSTNEISPKRVLAAAKRKPKAGYGISPFPNHPQPTPEACQEVYKVLSQSDKTIAPPPEKRAPRKGIATCGEVPSLLDALLRIRISANTSMSNANRAISGLELAFPQSVGTDTTVDWAKVHEAPLVDLVESIKSGGLQERKGADIKKILGLVFEQNQVRRDALLSEQKTGILADIPGVETLTAEQKADEIALIAHDPFTLEWIDHLPTADVVAELVKLPGIGVKTASCAILFNLRRPSFAVDTHVHRHCVRLGWVPATCKDPDKTFFHCDLVVPDELKYALHSLFIRHGQKCYRCRHGTTAGTKLWEDNECVIEHLVTRYEPKKQEGYRPSKKEVDDQVQEVEGKGRRGPSMKPKVKEEAEEEPNSIVKEPKPKRTPARRGKVAIVAVAIDEESDTSSKEEEASEFKDGKD